MKTNFSKDVRNVFSLALDLARDECDLQTEEGKMMKKRDMENYLRDKLNKDILGGKTLYQAVRRNNTLIYEIICRNKKPCTWRSRFFLFGGWIADCFFFCRKSLGYKQTVVGCW